MFLWEGNISNISYNIDYIIKIELPHILYHEWKHSKIEKFLE